MLFLKKINILLCNASLKVNMAKNGINKTIGDLTNDENIINVVSQSEEDHLIKYSEEALIIPSKLNMNSSLVDFSKADDSALIYVANGFKNRNVLTETVNRLSEEMEKMKKEMSSRIEILESESKMLQEDLLYPLLIRELLKQSR